MKFYKDGKYSRKGFKFTEYGKTDLNTPTFAGRFFSKPNRHNIDLQKASNLDMKFVPVILLKMGY